MHSVAVVRFAEARWISPSARRRAVPSFTLRALRQRLPNRLRDMSNDRIGRTRSSAPSNPSDASSSRTPAASSRPPVSEAASPARPELLGRLQGRRSGSTGATSATSSSSTSRARVASVPRRGAAARDERQRLTALVAAVETAQREGLQWQMRKVLGEVSTYDATLSRADEVIARLHAGLQALDEACALGAEPPQGRADVKAQLDRYLLQAAESGIVTLLDQMTQWQQSGMYVQGNMAAEREPIAASTSAAGGAAGPSRPQAGSQQPPSQAVLVTLGLEKLADARRRLAGYVQIVDAYPTPQGQAGPHNPMHAYARLAKQVAQSVTRDINGLSVELHIARLELLGTSFDSIMQRMDARAIRAVADVPAVHEVWDVIDRAQEVDPKQLASAKVAASAYLNGVDSLSEQLCIEAAGRIEANEDSSLWRYTLDTACAFQTYADFLRQVRDQARAGAATAQPLAAPSEATTHDEAAAGAAPSRDASTQDPAPPPDSAIQEARRTSSRRAAAPDSLATEHGGASARAEPAQPSAPSRPPRTNYRELVQRANGDVVAVAHALGKDASTLQQLRGPAFDPIESAQYARNAAQSWLGDLDNLRKAARRAATAPANASADPARLDQLTDRIEALTMVHQHIAAAEADALKALPCPKAKHLRRLLQLNELEHVGTPVRLPSAGDVDDKGTLFEIAIRPKPLASGEAARPLFVHLHTAGLMTAAAARTVPFRKLTAAHVKTEAHRRLGARWEQMANALGSVHRGKIDAALLGELRALSRAS